MSLRSAVAVPSGPDGRPWVVRRRWAPRLGHETLWGRFRRRIRSVARRASDLDPGLDLGCADDLLGGVLAVVAAVVVGLIVVLVVLPLLVALVELAVVLVLVVLGVVAKIVFRRPFVVEALHADPPVEQVLRWRVVGWGASADRCREVAQVLEAGVVPPDGERLTVRGRPVHDDTADSGDAPPSSSSPIA